MEKKIKISDNRILSYNTEDGYVLTNSIREDFFKNGKFEKYYVLSRWDDYEFNAYSAYDNTTRLFYEFDVEHPLYFPFLHLLNNDLELIIDDDNTHELEKKYMKLYKKDDKIVLEFRNKLRDNEKSIKYNRFNIFIKNIGPDCRSKIDCQYKDTKERIWNFFEETIQNITEEYHQFTIEEYEIKRKILK